jgi:predicted nucleotidyltransferase
MSSSGRRSQVSSTFSDKDVAFILKENGENIVKSLDQLANKTEAFLKEGYQLSKDMKMKKIRDMKIIDDVFEKITKKVLMKKALLKNEYNEHFNMELDRVNNEQENFQKHMSLINFTKETALKTVQELELF